MKKATIGVAETANMLGVSEQFVRCGLRAGKLPFGTALDYQGKGRRYTYVIYRERLEAFMKGRL